MGKCKEGDCTFLEPLTCELCCFECDDRDRCKFSCVKYDEDKDYEYAKCDKYITTNFYELYKQGKVSKNDIHDYIDIWHNRKIDDNTSLHEFLGMSWEQYALWVNKDGI